MSIQKFTSRNLPRSRLLRIIIGILLIIGGFLGFLPILGFWMAPLGVVVLSIDLPWVRRRRRRLDIWWGRKGKFKAIAMKDRFLGMFRRKKA